MKKNIAILTALFSCVFLSFSLIACDKPESNVTSEAENNIESNETASTEQTVSTEETASIEETPDNTEEESTPKYNEFIDEYNSFEVTSTSMNNGVWNDVISYTDKGSNKSPQLQWSAVDGADFYVIIMDDPESWHFMHWKSDNVTETSLEEGWAPESEYVGPYPPSGATRTYEVYVVALKAPVERVKGAFGFSNPKFEENFKELDIDAEGNSGNIIAVGRLSGTFTN